MVLTGGEMAVVAAVAVMMCALVWWMVICDVLRRQTALMHARAVMSTAAHERQQSQAAEKAAEKAAKKKAAEKAAEEAAEEAADEKAPGTTPASEKIEQMRARLLELAVEEVERRMKASPGSGSMMGDSGGMLNMPPGMFGPEAAGSFKMVQSFQNPEMLEVWNKGCDCGCGARPFYTGKVVEKSLFIRVCQAAGVEPVYDRADGG